MNESKKPPGVYAPDGLSKTVITGSDLTAFSESHRSTERRKKRSKVRWCQICGVRSDRGATIVRSGLERRCLSHYADRSLARRMGVAI